MERNEKDTTPTGSVIIGRDAKGNVITIDNSVLKDFFNTHITGISTEINELRTSVNNLSNTTSKIDDLSKEIENLYKRKKTHLPKWVYWVWLIGIVALGLSIASIFIVSDINWNVEVVSTTIILGFVGILATFIVVSNYMQVKEVKDKSERIENDFKDKTRRFEKENKIINEKIIKIETDLLNQIEQIKNANKVTEQIKVQEKSISEFNQSIEKAIKPFKTIEKIGKPEFLKTLEKLTEPMKVFEKIGSNEK
jgi:SMC interacting uncharacterized protein involved in chromosome segregation